MTDPAAWRIELRLMADRRDPTGEALAGAARELLGLEGVEIRTVAGYAVAGPADREGASHLAREVLGDPVLHEISVLAASERPSAPAGRLRLDVVKRPGVMDPSAGSVMRAAAAAGMPLEAVRSYRGYEIGGELSPDQLLELARRLLANDVIEEIIVASERPILPTASPGARDWERRTIPLTGLDDTALGALSESMGLALTPTEMRSIQQHFEKTDRDPTDLELETLAQTWSEHCKHKTLTGPIDFNGRRIDGLLQSTVFEVTRRLQPEWCLSVFEDNAGVVAFDDEQALTFKVETHNHPSAIEPYGGAGTGIGGVLRDTLGTGLGARPVLSTDVFCVGPQDLPAEHLPKGTLHPRRVLHGVIAGVRDYGNRMGIPTASGAVFFDERYVGNPLVFCGNVGLIPRSRVNKTARPDDVIVLIGGRTGRDGIHGATFSSLELHESSETVSSGAVQIGNAIEEKKVLDVIITARDRTLFSAITDCGAGGLSSAVGEMGRRCGAEVDLDHVPLKYEGLDYSEIWISEAQERMVLAVPPERLDELIELCRDEDVEITIIGRFTDGGRLCVRYKNVVVGDLEMDFLHSGLPRVVRRAIWSPPPARPATEPVPDDHRAILLGLLAMPNIASKEWIIRQYDHEVQAGSALKPLVGPHGDGPGDACVVAPRLGSVHGFAVSHGMNPCYGDLDPYRMAVLAVDEALRNIVSVGARPDRTAILDNFAWGNTDKPDRLGSLVRAAEGCRDAALAYGLPFISGKDSLNNEYRTTQGTIAVPPSLLISALGLVDDVRRTVSMDLKSATSKLLLVGVTRDETGGSHLNRRLGHTGGEVPRIDLEQAAAIHRQVHAAIDSGGVLACHDLSEGGLAVALAEMVMAGRVGATLELDRVPCEPDALTDDRRLYSESAPRYLLEVGGADVARIVALLVGLPCAVVGETGDRAELIINSGDRRHLVTLQIEALLGAFKQATPSEVS